MTPRARSAKKGAQNEHLNSYIIYCLKKLLLNSDNQIREDGS